MEGKHSTAKKAETNKPVKVFRLHGLTASIFANQAERDGDSFTYHKVSLTRTYKDGNEFKNTNSFSRDDLPVAQFLLARAYDYIGAIETAAASDDAA